MIPVVFPWLLIAIGVAVLAFGSRLAVLGAAVGALLGVGLLRLLPGEQEPWVTLALPLVLALLGAFGVRFMRRIIHLIVLVMGALGGAAIMLGVLDLFNLRSDTLDWLLALIGGVIGIVLVRRFDRWALIVLAGLVGALLTMRGLTQLLPTLPGTVATVLALALAAGGIGFQGGLLRRRMRAEPDAAPAAVSAPATSPAPTGPPVATATASAAVPAAATLPAEPAIAPVSAGSVAPATPALATTAPVPAGAAEPPVPSAAVPTAAAPAAEPPPPVAGVAPPMTTTPTEPDEPAAPPPYLAPRD